MVHFLGLAWARPDAAWALVLPILFLLLVRVLERPPSIAIGTLAYWENLPRHARDSASRLRGRPTPRALLLALALLLGALAWLGPRGAAQPGARTWTLVVDRSPSMGLPAPGGSGETRLEAALEAALAWLEPRFSGADRVRWIAPEREALELAPRELPPGAWLAAGPAPAREPDWLRHDEPGTLWLTDRVPALVREHAGFFASGGRTVPGAIAAEGRARILWDGERLRREENAAPPPVVVEPSAARLPPVLRRMLTAWSEARGFELSEVPGPTADLVLSAAGGGGPVLEVRLARDGWRASGRAWAAGAPPFDAWLDAEDWLVGESDGGERIAVVRAVPGQIRIALEELSEPSGDPALFALSFGRLLDRCALPPRDVIALAERAAAGEPAAEPGSAPRVFGAGADPGPHLDAALALAASVLGAGALFLGRPPRARPQARAPRT